MKIPDFSLRNFEAETRKQILEKRVQSIIAQGRTPIVTPPPQAWVNSG